MKRPIFSWLFPIIFFFITFLFPRLIYSQDVEKATRETDQLGREKKKIEEELKKVPEKPIIKKAEEAPKKETEQKFFIKKIDLVGCESFSPKDFSPIIEKYEGREVTLTELDTLAKEIEREYLRRGVIAAVFLPQQEIKEQAVILQVVEAKMGQLQIQEHKYFKKQRLTYYWKVPPGEILHYDKISKSIQMMNKNSDRQVKAALTAGKKPGTTDIVLTPQTHFPIHLTSTFDNEGSSSTGKNRTGAGIRHNNFLGFDDTFLSGYTFGREFSGTYAYHSLPISSGGASLLYGYSLSESTPKKEFAVYGIKSKAENASVSLHQDIFNKDQYLGEVSLGFDAKDKATVMNTGTYSRDRLRIVSLNGDFIFRGLGSTTTLSPEFSQGIDAFGASPSDNPLASRGAKTTFSKFILGIQHRRILPLNLQANFKLKGQVSSTKLTPQEEFSLGGMDSVRGYPSGDYQADNMISNSLEVLMPAFFIPGNWQLPFYKKKALKDMATPVVFVDYGYGERRGALETEKKSVNFLGVGAGVRIRLFDQTVLRLEWGFPVADDTITEAGHSRFHFSVSFQS